jgi:hypothetical protein
MSDAYGEIQFRTSNQCKLDVGLLIKELNTFEWDRSNGRWIEKDEQISYSCDWSQYPTVFPKQPVLLAVKSSQGDGFSKKYFTELMNGEFPNLDESEQDKYYDSPACPLPVISNKLAKYIKLGWLEISCHANQKGDIYLQRLRVQSDEKAIRFSSYFPSDEMPIHTKEEYTYSRL